MERHGTLKKYIKAKLKLLDNQKSGSFAFVNKDDDNLMKFLKKKKYKSSIIKVNTKLDKREILKINNNYLLSVSNKQNLSFVLEIIKKFKIKNNLLYKSIRELFGCEFRQNNI